MNKLTAYALLLIHLLDLGMHWADGSNESAPLWLGMWIVLGSIALVRDIREWKDAN